MSQLTTAVKRTIHSVLRDDVHTIKPAVITKVDYETCSVSAKPTTKTLWSDDKNIEFGEVYEVPILINQGGGARLTFPVKAGDLCWILFSDREFGNLLDTNGKIPVDSEDREAFGGYAIGALVGWHTRPTAKEILSDAVVLEYGDTIIKVYDDSLDISTANVSIQVNDNNINITSTENILVNGLTITPQGGIITAQGVNLDEFYQAYLIHTHTSSSPGSPTSPPLP